MTDAQATDVLVPRTRSGWRWLIWVALGLALVIALVVGTRGSGHRATLNQRTYSVASGIRCPVCEGESAANSDSPPAREIVAFIRQQLAAGQSPTEIRGALVASYGSSILLRPSTSGISAVVWVLPVAVVVVALVGLGLVFARRRRTQAAASVSDADRALVQEMLGS